MKILFISDYYPPYIKGGAEVSTSLLVDWLVKKGHQIAVACTQLANQSWVEKSVSVYPIIRKASLGNKDFGSAVKYGIGIVIMPIVSILALIKLIKQFRPDIINVIPSSYQFIPIIIASRIFFRLPVIIDCRDGSLICPVFYGKMGLDDTKYSHHGYRCLKAYEVNNKFLKLFTIPFAFYESFIFNTYKYSLRFLINHFSGIELIALSEFMRQQLILNGFSPNKIKIIHNIAPLYDFEDRNLIKSNTLTFAYAGRIEKEKGIFDIISAIEILLAESLAFDTQIAGVGPDFEKLQILIKEKGLNNIYLLGHIKSDEVLDLYEKSSVIIGPSRSPEGFGRFVLESISVGKPIIATRSGGIPEGIEDGITGLLIDVGNVKQLATAMRHFIENPEKIEIMKKAIIKKQKYYETGFIGEKRLELYKRVATHIISRERIDNYQSAE